LLIFNIQLTYSQIDIGKIQFADKLFQQKQYDEAFDLYFKIKQSTNKVSSDMLMKMAFISESKARYVDALYFLNLYYNLKPDNEVLLHIQSLATQYRLQGYDYSDWELVHRLYLRYQIHIWSILMILCVSLLAVWLYMRRQKVKILLRHQFAFMIFLLALLFFINIYKFPNYAIINQDNTYWMEAPSAGSKVLKQINKGHRVLLLAKNDIWYKIQWQEQIGYIRQGHLRIIE
jgi:hypothetical protein